MPDLKPGYNPIPLFLAARRSNLRHCERSEAIQLSSPRQNSWIASSLALLAMTVTRGG
jgi:hypothetical protein